MLTNAVKHNQRTGAPSSSHAMGNGPVIFGSPWQVPHIQAVRLLTHSSFAGWAILPDGYIQKMRSLLDLNCHWIPVGEKLNGRGLI